MKSLIMLMLNMGASIARELSFELQGGKFVAEVNYLVKEIYHLRRKIKVKAKPRDINQRWLEEN